MEKKKIEALTPEQEARLVECREKWLACGLSTKPADREKAERGIALIYEAHALPPPKKIVWCGSPLGVNLTKSIVLDGFGWKLGRGDEVSDSVWDWVFDAISVSTQAFDKETLKKAILRDQDDDFVCGLWLGSETTDKWCKYREALGQVLEIGIRSHIHASTMRVVYDAVEKGSERFIRRASSVGRFGDLDITPSEFSVVCIMDYYCNVLGFSDGAEFMRGYALLAEAAQWFLPSDEICWISERPTVFERDEHGRIHCLSGPALVYPDGWKVYAYHGIQVPEWVITRPQDLTCLTIDMEENAEIRRAMIELYGGQSRYMLDSGAEVISHDEAGILLRRESPVQKRDSEEESASHIRLRVNGGLSSEDEPIVMVRVLNSTPEPDGVLSRQEAITLFGPAAKAAVDAPEDARFKEYMIRVPPAMKTAREAVAWTFGLEAEDYHPAIES